MKCTILDLYRPFVGLFCCVLSVAYLPGLGLAVAQFIDKVLAVPSEDAVRQHLADGHAGVLHNNMNWVRFILFVQVVVDLPAVGSHHVPQLIFPDDGLFTYDRHDTAGPCACILG